MENIIKKSHKESFMLKAHIGSQVAYALFAPNPKFGASSVEVLQIMVLPSEIAIFELIYIEKYEE